MRLPRPLQEHSGTKMQTGDRKGDAALGQVSGDLGQRDGTRAVHEIDGTGLVLCPQRFNEAIDATVLDRRGELRALCDVHAYAFDDDIDDSELAVGAAQSPIDADVLGG